LVPVHFAVIVKVETPNAALCEAVTLSVADPVGVVVVGEKAAVSPVGAALTVQLRFPQFGSKVPLGKLHPSEALPPSANFRLAPATAPITWPPGTLAGVGVAVGFSVGVAVGLGVAVGFGVGVPTGVGEGVGVGFGVGDGVGVGVAFGFGVTTASEIVSTSP